MIYELISMNGYGAYVWSAFLFTLFSFTTLYLLIKLHLTKEQIKLKTKFTNLADSKMNSVKNQKIYKEILVNTSVSKI